MSGQLQRLALIARTLAPPALLGGAAVCIAVIVLTSSPRARWPGLGALALCVGAAFVLDDPASATIDASPTSLARRRMLRIVLPLLCGVGAASLYYATSANGPPLGPDARGALSVQFIAMLAITLGASAAALRMMPGERGGWAAVIALLALFVAAYYLPQRWTLLAVPGDAGSHGAQQRWALRVLVLGGLDPLAGPAGLPPLGSVGEPGAECARARDPAWRPGRRVASPGGWVYAGAAMADLVDRVRRELDARIEQLRPLVGELERLERAAAALARAGARAVPGFGARPPAAAAKPGGEPAGGSTRAKSAARKPPAQSRGAVSGRTPAPRGQTQARVLAALRAAPGSTSAAVATAAGVPTNTAAATISRLVRQGRVRRLDEGGYAPVETPAGAAQLGAAAASTDAAAVASDTPGAAAPAADDAETPR